MRRTHYVMGYRLTCDHVRVRFTPRHTWIWEFITADGHIAATSTPFDSRDACEAEARQQGMPLTGGRKPANRKQYEKRRPEGMRVYCEGHGLWRWERADEDARVIESSPVAFLTRDECERDLQANFAQAEVSSADAARAPMTS